MSRFEHPQPGNPHQLTVQQHVFPRQSIARFCASDGRVRVRYLPEARDLILHPKDPLFCVQRAWDQRGESLVGGSIEIPFQEIADRLADGSLPSLVPEMQASVTQMYLLWRQRSLLAIEPIAPIRLHGVTPSELTEDEQERLEKAGVAFVGPDGTMRGRVVAGHKLQHGIDADWIAGAHAMQWGVLRCPGGLELIVPDAFIAQPVLPITPRLCLASGVSDAEMSACQVAEINRTARVAARRYWFARCPELCPF